MSNTGLNNGVGNASTNKANSTQDATATSTDGDAAAVNQGSASNNSNGSTSIITGNANAVGSQSTNKTVQVVDADNADGLVLADQTANTTNLGFGLANTGFNVGAANVSTNTANPTQTATATGANDQVASNTIAATNTSNGNTVIGTGNASATGNLANNDTTQTLDADSVARVSEPVNATLPLGLLVLFGFLFIGTPVRRLGYRRRV